MKKFMTSLMLTGMMICVPVLLLAEGYNEYMAKGDALMQRGGYDNFRAATNAYLQAVAINPGSYEANWKVAKGIRLATEIMKWDMADNWAFIGSKECRKGMDYAKKAIDLNPKQVDAYFWYGACVGGYYDGVGLVTALKDNLKDKTQDSFEKVYVMDKTYWQCYSIMALGRFWYVLPWPLNNKTKAMSYLRELQRLNPSLQEGKLYLAEALLDSKKPKDREEGIALLNAVMQGEHKIYRVMAKDLLVKSQK